MGLIETPAKQLAEALVESPIYGHIVSGFAADAWAAERGYNGRVTCLAKKLRNWMRERNPTPADVTTLELFFFDLAINAFNWLSVAEHVTEELGLDVPRNKPKLRSEGDSPRRD